MRRLRRDVKGVLVIKMFGKGWASGYLHVKYSWSYWLEDLLLVLDLALLLFCSFAVTIEKKKNASSCLYTSSILHHDTNNYKNKSIWSKQQRHKLAHLLILLESYDIKTETFICYCKNTVDIFTDRLQ